MSKSKARFVSIYFLLTAALDISHPCSEKLECVGLILDHINPSRISAAVVGPQENPQEPNAHPPVTDDDCFCCRSDIVVQLEAAQVGPPDKWAPLPFSPATGDSPFMICGLWPLKPPPFGGILSNSIPGPPRTIRRQLWEMLSADLLPPPGPTKKARSCSLI